MSTTEIVILNLLMLAVVIEADIGRRKIGWFRVLRPVATAAAIAPLFLRTLSTAGNDVVLQSAAVLAGAALGVLCSLLMAVYWNSEKGHSYSRAAYAYAALWAAVTAGRLAFLWGTQHGLAVPLGQFLVTHQLTGAALGNAFVLVSLTMAVTRSLVLGTRAVVARRQAAIA